MGFAAIKTHPARFAIPALIALLAGSVLLALAAGHADGKGAKVLGKESLGPKPACPTTDKKACQVINSVTAFQTVAGGKRQIFKVPSDGAIVAWSIQLSNPSQGEKASFNGLFDGSPSAQLAILKKKDKNSFRLTKHSHTVPLKSYYGEQPIFTLRSPLRVKKGRVVAITTNTWLPTLAYGGKLNSKDDKWRSSRRIKRCGDDPNKTDQENRADLLKSKPHRKKGTTRTYGCTYDNARILYTAYLAES
jgi:hypothetical protein